MTDQTGTVDRKPGSGKTRKTHTAQTVDAVVELALGQENAPGTHRIVNQIFDILEFPNISASSDRQA